MTINRQSVVLAAMADAAGNGSPSVIDRICRVAVSLLSLRGAGLSLMVDGELRGTAGVSEHGIAAVQELQLTLGEGPCVDAWAGGHPVLEPDLADPAVVRWPAFAQAGVESGVLAVFAFPMHLGAIRIGVLALYRDRLGVLSADELAYGLVLADVATQAVLGLQAGALGVAHAVCGDRERAEDVVQEAFVSVWRGRAAYRSERGEVHAWVLGIVRNRAIDSLRRERRHARERHRGNEALMDEITASADVEEDVVGRDQARRLRAVVARLPVAQREVIALAYFGELSHSEIARELDVSMGTVKGRMRLGLDKLRSEITA